MLPGRLAAPTSGERLGSPKCYGSARVLGDRGVPIRSYSLGPQHFSESSCQPHLLHFLRSSELQAASFKLQASSFKLQRGKSCSQPTTRPSAIPEYKPGAKSRARPSRLVLPVPRCSLWLAAFTASTAPRACPSSVSDPGAWPPWRACGQTLAR